MGQQATRSMDAAGGVLRIRETDRPWPSRTVRETSRVREMRRVQETDRAQETGRTRGTSRLREARRVRETSGGTPGVVAHTQIVEERAAMTKLEERAMMIIENELKSKSKGKEKA